MSKRARRTSHHHRGRVRTSNGADTTGRPASTDLSTVDRRSDRLLDRILAAPHLAQVVPRLQPDVLHRVIQHCGLEDCGPLVELLTPGQVSRLFDLDLWRPAAPGLDDRFDANRFGVWLDVMVDAGVSHAAATLAAMDADVIAAGFVQHVRVFDYAAVAPYVTLDGDVTAGAAFADGIRCDVGGFVVVARRTEFWDAMTAVLTALADAHAQFFNLLMRECCRQSDSRPEVDGLDDLLTVHAQAAFDLGADREARRETEAFVTPAQARAFLHTSRRIDLRGGAMPDRDPVTRAYFRSIAAQIATEHHDANADASSGNQTERTDDVPGEAVAAILDLLHEAGAIPQAPRALLETSQSTTPRLALITNQLQYVQDHDPDAHAMRGEELAYLANVLMTGSSIQARALSAEEASNAAVAVCNLGLENWPHRWLARARLPDNFLIQHDLVTVFQVGWTVLHEDVCMHAAATLLSALATIDDGDGDVQEALDTLRGTLTKRWRAGSPWEARDAFEVLAILDMPAWAALLGLIDQLPTLHAAVDAVLSGTTHHIDAAAFEFISENAHIQRIRDFLERLPAILRS